MFIFRLSVLQGIADGFLSTYTAGMIKLLQQIARKAGKMAMQGHGALRSGDVFFKSEADLVTSYDRKLEEYISGRLQKKFPDIAFLGEESAGDAEENGEWRRGDVFILDPIDGTTNFVHGLPHFAVSLAYLRDAVSQAGVVYAPALGKMYSAVRGGGAFVNGKPIRVSSTDSLQASLAVTGFINMRQRIQPDNVETFRRVGHQVRSVLRLGSAALDLCHIAEGSIDFFWETGLHIWDIAAGVLLVEEAGGILTDMHGNDRYMDGSQGILAAAPAVHAVALAEVKL